MPLLIRSFQAADSVMLRENHRGTSRDITTQTVFSFEVFSRMRPSLFIFLQLEDSTLSKSMTIVASSARLRNARESLPSQETRLISRGGNRASKNHHVGSESDTSLSPTNEFSNAPTYRIPVKHSRDIFRPDSSTESNNDQSPIRDRRSNTPRHISRESNNSHSMDMLQSANR